MTDNQTRTSRIEGRPAASGSGPFTVFGGTGFLGRRIVRHLLEQGAAVRVASRHPNNARRMFGTAATPVEVDIANERQVADALDGAQGAVNTVSLYVEAGGSTFEEVHVEGARRVAEAAARGGVEQLVHISGIGADPRSASPYIKARGRGEEAVRAAFPAAAIARPAVMFAPDDVFLTTIVGLVRRLPIIPLFGRGDMRLQPVHVEDVACALERLLRYAPDRSGATYEFAGPRIYTYEELVKSVGEAVGRQVRTAPMPLGVWHGMAHAAEFLPGAPLTRNQIELMQAGNVASRLAPGLREFDIEPTALEAVARQIASR